MALTSLGTVISSEPFYNWNLITADPEDNKYVDCAIRSNADFIVTNNKHFNILKQINFPKVTCITIEEFMDKLKSMEK